MISVTQLVRHASARSERSTVTASAVLVRTTRRAIALWDGETIDVTDPRTGEVTQMRHLWWLPRSVVTINSSTTDAAGHTIVSVTMPDWLAKKTWPSGRPATTATTETSP